MMIHQIELLLLGAGMWALLCLLAPLFRLDPETREIRRRKIQKITSQSNGRKETS